MNLSEFCAGISLMPEAVEQMQKLNLSEADYPHLQSLFHSNRDLFCSEIKQRENFRILFLYCYARMACEVYPLYHEQKIPERIYWDTFYDLTLWCENCYRLSGEYGIGQYDWFFLHLDLKLFRLGRLEFEILPSPWALQTDSVEIHPGNTIIHVHIPQGEPLDAAACQNAFKQAQCFWGHPYAYLCHSWLLYPGLQEILRPTSHILRFQKFFTLLQTDYDTREAEERIFDKVESNPRNYSENTSLQRAAKSYLLSGNRLGNGLGILQSDKI